MQNQNNTNPMETGSIPKLLAQLAIPAVVAQIINLLYNYRRPNLYRTYPRDRRGCPDRCRTFCTDFDAP